MRIALGCLALLAAALTLVSAPVPKEKPKLKDEDAILGIWAIEKVDAGGEAPKEAPTADEVAKIRMEFKKNNKYRFWGGPNGDGKEIEYKLDPSAKLKTIDLIDGGRTTLGLYEIDGDRLKICYSVQPRANRPEEMKSNDLGYRVVTLKRVKDEAKVEKREEKKAAKNEK